MRLLKWPIIWLIEYAQRTPYFHLYHVDGSAYMRRWWLIPDQDNANGGYKARWWRNPLVWFFQLFGIAIRIHLIKTPDLDRDLHDHPWWWASLILKGWYIEERPVSRNPCFVGDYECTYTIHRTVGSFAINAPYDRHRIVTMSDGGVFTLFITLPKAQWWGFYTKAGKIFHHDYEGTHNNCKPGIINKAQRDDGGIDFSDIPEQDFTNAVHHAPGEWKTPS